MTDWSMWSTCSSAASCGPGTQKSYRNYKNEAKAVDLGCNRQRTRERQCDVPCGLVKHEQRYCYELYCNGMFVQTNVEVYRDK